MSNEMFNTSFEDIVEMKNIDYNTINLVVAKSLLDMIGGSIEFINEKGKGTQYVIKLKQKLSSQNRLGNIKDKIQTNYDLSHRIINLLVGCFKNFPFIIKLKKCGYKKYTNINPVWRLAKNAVIGVKNNRN